MQAGAIEEEKDTKKDSVQLRALGGSIPRAFVVNRRLRG
jgi:hypothetical protein